MDQDRRYLGNSDPWIADRRSIFYFYRSWIADPFFIFTDRIVFWIVDPYFYFSYKVFLRSRQNSCSFKFRKVNEKIIQILVFKNQPSHSFKFSFLREFRKDQLNFYRLKLSSAEFGEIFPNHFKFSRKNKSSFNNKNQKCLDFKKKSTSDE